MVRKVLLVCGLLSSLLYVATVILAPMRWEGYSSTSQTVSELIAIDAPVTERINIFAYMLWVVVLTVALLRAQGERSQDGLGGKSVSGRVGTDSRHAAEQRFSIGDSGALEAYTWV
jgi:hypothetical protein